MNLRANSLKIQSNVLGDSQQIIEAQQGWRVSILDPRIQCTCPVKGKRVQIPSGNKKVPKETHKSEHKMY